LSDDTNPILNAVEIGMIALNFVLIPAAVAFWVWRWRRSKKPRR
jgi:hypothetical protein